MDSSPTEHEQPPDDAGSQTFALRSGRVPVFTPLVFGFVGGSTVLNILELTHKLTEVQIDIAASAAAVLATALATALLRRSVPDRIRIAETQLQLVRGTRVVRRVDLEQLKEVSEFHTPAGQALVVADRKRHITLPIFALADPQHYEEISHEIVATMERVDPTGAVARGAVKTGRLRETISQQPVRGTYVLAGFVALASLLAFSNRTALAGLPYPEEAMGALSTPLLLRGEAFRMFSYLFLHASGLHLAVCTVGLLYIGSYLERLLGWERVLLGFVAGAVGGALGHVLLSPPLPAIGASGALFGLFGMLASVAVLKRRLPPTLKPHAGFWLLSVLLAMLLPATTETQTDMMMWGLAGVQLGGAVLGFLTGLLLVAGVDIPATHNARNIARPFAVLGAIALVIGIVGSIVLPRRNHAEDDAIVTRALLDLPQTPVTANIQNEVAYSRLSDPKRKGNQETIDLFAQLAARAVQNSNRKVPDILDTLAVARYLQGETDEARSILNEALKLPVGPESAKLIRRHQEDIESGAPLRPDAEPEK